MAKHIQLTLIKPYPEDYLGENLKLAVIDDFISLVWTDRFAKAGDFELVMPLTEKNLELFQHDRMLISNVSDHAMIIEKIEITKNANGKNNITIKGRSLESLLERRIVWETVEIVNFDMDKKGIVTINTPLDTILIDQLINPNIIEDFAEDGREIPNLYTIDDNEDPAESKFGKFEIEANYKRGDNLYTAVCNVCQSYNIGFHILLEFTQPMLLYAWYYDIPGAQPFLAYTKSASPHVGETMYDSNGAAYSKDVYYIQDYQPNVGDGVVYVQIGGLDSQVVYPAARAIDRDVVTGGTSGAESDIQFRFEFIMSDDHSLTQVVEEGQTPNNIVYFSSNIENLRDVQSVSDTEKYKNVALVLGEIKNDNEKKQKTATVMNYDSDGLTGFSRREVCVDASDIEQKGIKKAKYTKLLEQRGEEYLASPECQTNLVLDGYLVIDNPYYTYGIEYKLGDYVQLTESSVNASSKVRIEEMVFSDDQNGFEATAGFVNIQFDRGTSDIGFLRYVYYYYDTMDLRPYGLKDEEDVIVITGIRFRDLALDRVPQLDIPVKYKDYYIVLDINQSSE